MSQNYNVDDILEEIRRKKSRQTPTESTGARTYDTPPHDNRRPPIQPRREQEPYRESRQEPREARQEARQPSESRRAPRGEQPAPQEPHSRTERWNPPADSERVVPQGMPDIPPIGSRSSHRREATPMNTQEQPVRRGAPERAGGFDFRAPGVADDRDSSSLYSANALQPQSDDFSLHFNLDDKTEETPKPAKKRAARAARDTQELDGLGWPAAEKKPQENRLAHSQWRQSYTEQELLEQDSSEDDYADEKDAPYVAKDLRKIRIGLGVRLGLTGVLMLVLGYLALAVREFPYAELFGLEKGFKLLLLDFMWPENDMRLFLIINLTICVITAIVGSNVIGAGIASLCKMRADADSPAAIAMLAVLIQGIVLVVFPDTVSELPQISLYFPVAAAILFFTLIGKIMLMNRVWRNFAFLSGDKHKHAFLQIQNRDFAREFSRGLGPDISRVSYSAEADFMTGFLDKSYSGDYSDTFSCVAAPVSLAGGILVGVVTAVMSKDAVLAVSAFAAVMCICAPFSSEIVPNLMLGRMSKWLTKRGAMLAGYEVAEDCAETGAILLSDKDLFSEDSIHLHGMKVFAEKRIDEAILDAASVIITCDGIMSGVFLNMIGGNKALLKKVDGLIYEDGMGLSAWVDGKRVLIGSHELMRNHEIDCPSRDYEARYIRDGRKVLYIASSGELSAMFVISYNGEPKIAERLADLQRRGVSLALFATDPNVTPELVASAFNIKKGNVRVLPAKLHPEYNYLTRRKERVSSGVAHVGGMLGMLQVIRASSSVCRSVHAGAIVQLIGIIVGYGLVAFMAFTNSLELISYMTVIIFSLVCMIITSLASSCGKT